ncbi:MAG: hypothetical protein M3N43_04705 [Actinomycetota bacterium]|nr:hypothetical protein [Actinomycetota bacterium]
MTTPEVQVTGMTCSHCEHASVFVVSNSLRLRVLQPTSRAATGTAPLPPDRPFFLEVTR